MIQTELILPEYRNLLGWRQHYDLSEVNLPINLTDTITGEFFQDKHAALSLPNIQSTIPPNRSLESYLSETTDAAIAEMFNDFLQYRKMKKNGKSVIDSKVLLHKYGWAKDKIVNRNRFVGFLVKTKSIIGLTTIIEQIGIQLDGAQTVPIYLFHSSKKDPIGQFDLTATGLNWDWEKINVKMESLKAGSHNEGSFVIGYYQDDLIAQAINYSNFDWEKGVCGYCPNTQNHYTDWKAISKYFMVYPVYVPNGSYVKGQMFDLEDSVFSRTESFGLNMKLSVKCDLTEFFIEQKESFKNLLSIKVTHKVLQMMKFSQQINHLEENIKMMIIRDLEGDIETKLTNIPTQYNNELKAVAFDFSGINTVCLPCENDTAKFKFGVIGN